MTSKTETALETRLLRIDGMTCVNCQNRIEKKLKNTAGVEDARVNYTDGTAAVTWHPAAVSLGEIKAAVESLGYKAQDGAARALPKTPPWAEITGTLVIIMALYALLRGLGIGTIAASFPLAAAGAAAGAGYGMLFVIGLITSVHCAAMCGGINLSQCLAKDARGAAAGAADGAGRGGTAGAAAGAGAADGAGAGGGRWRARPPAAFPPVTLLLPSIFYNGGRIISYTAVGVIAGAAGSVVSVSGRFQGVVQIIAGVFMVIMGLNMLTLFQGSLGRALRRFNLRMPRIFAKKIDEQKSAAKNPLIIGLLNGLMPCGPLQAMQLYALSTGSPLAGGVSMFLFSMGTVPLMFGIGALSSLLSGAAFGRAFAGRVTKAGAMLVTVMGMTMFTYGWALGGLPGPAQAIAAAAAAAAGMKSRGIYPAGAAGATAGAIFTPVIENGVQIVNSTLSGGRYPAITVQRGIPVKWTINAPPGSVNGCNNRVIIREYGIEHRFKPGENVLEFNPEKSGKFSYSCWMGMIRSSITVVEEGESAAAAPEPDLNPVPAGVSIPADKAVLAKIEGRFQTVTINLRDDGIDPAVIVLQRDIPLRWTITNNSLDSGNSRLIFPAYSARLDMKQGDNVIQLMPSGDFDFSTGDNVFYGFVKVVDDLAKADIEAIKAEAANVETRIYPEAYFEAAAGQGGGCCGGAGA